MADSCSYALRDFRDSDARILEVVNELLAREDLRWSPRLACTAGAAHVTGMDTGEGEAILANRLAGYRALSHGELTGLLLAPVADEVTGPSGKRYQVVVQASWTGSPGGELRVVAGVDDRGWQLFNPLTDSFVSQPAAAHGGVQRNATDSR